MNSIKLLVSGAALVLCMNSTTQAQVMVDMSKFTCEQLLKGTQNSVEAAIWISGYYNGLRKNTMFDLNQFKTNADAVVKACQASTKNTVMQTVDTLSAKK